MGLKEDFQQATEVSKVLSRRPNNDELLLLYALFKQSTDGDIQIDRPSGFDFKAIAKFDAWAEQKGKSKDTAMEEYIRLVKKLQSLYT